MGFFPRSVWKEIGDLGAGSSRSIRRSCGVAAILGTPGKGMQAASGRGNSMGIPFKLQGFCSKRGGFNGGKEDGASQGCSSIQSPLSQHQAGVFLLFFFLTLNPADLGFCGHFRCDPSSAAQWNLLLVELRNFHPLGFCVKPLKSSQEMN